MSAPWPNLPVYLDRHGMSILDATHAKVLDIRGWGCLTGMGGLQLPQKEALRLQEELGERLVAFLNTSGTERKG